MQAKTSGGIYLPETAVKDLNEAKVLAVGPGLMDKDGKRLAMGVKAGDRVLIPQVRALEENDNDTHRAWIKVDLHGIEN